MIGEKVHAAWSLASSNLEAAVKRFGPPLLQAAGAIVGKIAGVGFGMLGFAVSVLIAGFLFVPGPRLGDVIKTFARRIAADRGAHFVDLAGATIRNISRGVIGVALLQALLTGLILTLFGVPAAGVIAFLVLIFCIVQVGPVPVVLPVIIWAWSAKDTGPALLLTLLLIVIPVIDNVLKPILMARGLSTPMLVILLGVIGGTVSYGLIGLFLGPILLGIFYELLMAWVKNETPKFEQAGSDLTAFPTESDRDRTACPDFLLVARSRLPFASSGHRVHRAGEALRRRRRQARVLAAASRREARSSSEVPRVAVLERLERRRGSLRRRAADRPGDPVGGGAHPRARAPSPPARAMRTVGPEIDTPAIASRNSLKIGAAMQRMPSVRSSSSIAQPRARIAASSARAAGRGR